MEDHSIKCVNILVWIGIIISVIALLAPIVLVRGDKCAELLNIDCGSQYKPEGNETLCCSDFRVYANLCFFAQAKCRDPSLTSLYPGQCVNTTSSVDVNATLSPMTSSTPVSLASTTTDNVIHAVFCTYGGSLTCPDALDPICGSDNRFYKNMCCFAKAQCNNTALTYYSDLDICKVAQRFRRDVQCG